MLWVMDFTLDIVWLESNWLKSNCVNLRTILHSTYFDVSLRGLNTTVLTYVRYVVHENDNVRSAVWTNVDRYFYEWSLYRISKWTWLKTCWLNRQIAGLMTKFDLRTLYRKLVRFPSASCNLAEKYTVWNTEHDSYFYFETDYLAKQRTRTWLNFRCRARHAQTSSNSCPVCTRTDWRH